MTHEQTQEAKSRVVQRYRALAAGGSDLELGSSARGREKDNVNALYGEVTEKNTPASVVRYAALLSSRTFSFSAHAKDIWTTPEWEKREKIAASLWGVTCTAQGADYLKQLAPEP